MIWDRKKENQLKYTIGLTKGVNKDGVVNGMFPHEFQGDCRHRIASERELVVEPRASDGTDWAGADAGRAPPSYESVEAAQRRRGRAFHCRCLGLRFSLAFLCTSALLCRLSWLFRRFRCRLSHKSNEWILKNILLSVS